jgi:hypothetical protein
MMLMMDAMLSVARLDAIDAIDGGLADAGDGESDYGQIDEELSAKIMEYQEGQLAVAINEEEGYGIEEDKEEEEEEEEEEKEEEEEQKEKHGRMELEV